MQTNNKINSGIRLSVALKDLFILFMVIIIMLAFSYFFNFFIFLVRLFQEYPKALMYIDEIITFFLTLSIGLAIFSWRRWRELKKETAERIRLQEELISIAKIEAETEKIISKQLRCEIEIRKNEENNKSSAPKRKKFF